MSAGSIVVDLLMRTGSFETDTDRAAKSLARFKKEAAQTAKEVGAVLGVAAAAAGTALVAVTKQAIDAADNLSKLSAKTGETAETLSALQYAFELGGVAGDEFEGAMAKLARSMSDAAGGSGSAAEAFAALRVSVTNADGTLRPMSDVLDDLADKFAGQADGATKSARAMDIFGKAGANLVPVFNGGAAGLAAMRQEAQQLGIVIGSQTAKAAEEFNDTLSRVRKGADAVGITLATATLPALKTVADELLIVTSNSGGARTSLAAFTKDAAVGLAVLVEGAVGAAKAIYAIGGSFRSVAEDVRFLGTVAQRSLFNLGGGLLNGDNRQAIGAALDERNRVAAEANQRYIDAWNYDGARISTAIRRAMDEAEMQGARRDAFTDPRSVLFGKGGKGGGSAGGAGGSRGSRAGAAAPRAMPASYQDNVAQAVGQAIDGSAVVRARELADQIGYLDKLFFEAGLSADVYESAMRKLTGQTEPATDATSEFLREQERLAALLGNTASAQLEAQREDMQLLAKAYEAGRISVEQYVEAVQARLGSVRAAGDSARTMADDLGSAFADAFEDAIVGGNKLADVLQGLQRSILRIVTQELVTKPFEGWLSKALKGGGGGGGGGFVDSIGSFISSIFGGAGGGAGGGGDFMSSIGSFISSIFGGGRAIGGPVDAGGLYRVNERGSPEMLQIDGREFLMMGNRRGWVDANTGATGKAGSTYNTAVTVNMPAGSSVATANQAGAAVARRLQLAAQRNG